MAKRFHGDIAIHLQPAWAKAIAQHDSKEWHAYVRAMNRLQSYQYN